ncbi:MAG: hypothetical protein O7F16_05150, partial [Acidobacteria bacterium]|nr:hypothetical protein [Acidobacteriota bacterium]
LPFKKGGFVMALETGTPVVPIAVQGGREVLPKNRLSLRPGRMRVRTMPPIHTKGRGVEARDALITEVRAAIEQGLRQTAPASSSSAGSRVNSVTVQGV